MGTPLASQTVSGYNASPPPDDGSVTAANKVTWNKIKTQLSDPLNSFDSSINTALRTALNVTPTSQSTAYTTTTADHLRPIEVTGTTTISLGDAATMVAAAMGYAVPIVNNGTATVTVAVITATDKIAGRTNGTVTLAPGQGMIFTVNSTSNGYDITASTGFAPFVLTGAAGTNTATANAPANLTALFAGLQVLWTPAVTNTGATTLAITPSGGSALAATNVFVHGAACTGGELKASVPLKLEYDGTQFNVLGGGLDGFPNASANTFLAGPTSGAAAQPTFRAIAAADGASHVLITSGSVSVAAQATITTGIDATYDEYEIHLHNIIPATNNVALSLQVSEDGGSTWKAGATAYEWAVVINSAQTTAATGNNSTGTTQMQVTGGAAGGLSGIANLSNGNSNFVIKMFKPSSTTLDKVFTWVGSFLSAEATAGQTNITGAGRYKADTAAINGIKFFPGSGNISLTWYLYGIKKA